MPVERLRRRREYRAVAGGRKVSRPGFILQALRTANPERPSRFGFTVTKRIGNAVVRNRIRRRLKEAVRLTARDATMTGMDYVLIGRRAALSLPFDRLMHDLSTGMAALSRENSAGDTSRT